MIYGCSTSLAQFLSTLTIERMPLFINDPYFHLPR